MANRFQRNAIPNGDLNAWAPIEETINNRTLGENTAQLFDDSGVLKIKTGLIGFNNGLANGAGVLVIDTEATISLVGVSNSNWHKVEASVTGAAINFSVTAITGANDPATLPTEFTDSYNGEKGGFYITTTKRVLGLVWVNSVGAIAGIVNCLSSNESYVGTSLDDSGTDTIEYLHEKKVYNTRGVRPWAYTNSGILIAEADIVNNEVDFYILKSITSYFDFDNALLYAFQNSSARTIAGNISGIGTTYGIMLNPGRYKIQTSGGPDFGKLYVTGAYDQYTISDVDTISRRI